MASIGTLEEPAARRARLKAPASVTRSIVMSSDLSAKTPKSILSRQNSSTNLGGMASTTDMQIALLSQKVKDGSRGSVRVACAVRAVGGGNILQEPLAPYLAGGEEMRALLANRARREDARVVENVAVRHRAIDDVILRHCAPEDGIRQVVSVNGGLDTRANRLNLPDVAWFDVDLFDVLELKGMLEKAPEALKHYASRRVASVTNVGMDVLTDAPRYLKLELEKHGVDFTRPVLYVFEACLYNFSAADARALTRSLPRRNGSVVVGTHLQRGMLRWVRDPRHQAEAPYLAELSHHWRSSVEDAAKAGAFRVARAQRQVPHLARVRLRIQSPAEPVEKRRGGGVRAAPRAMPSVVAIARFVFPVVAVLATQPDAAGTARTPRDGFEARLARSAHAGRAHVGGGLARRRGTRRGVDARGFRRAPTRRRRRRAAGKRRAIAARRGWRSRGTSTRARSLRWISARWGWGRRGEGRRGRARASRTCAGRTSTLGCRRGTGCRERKRRARARD